MGQTKLPSAQRSSANFLIGKDRHGRWVVQDETGLHGGLFVSHAQALKFALSENGNRPQAVTTVPHILEFDGRAA